MKNNKKPKWLLLDQFHIDIEIQSDMSAKDRKVVLKDLRDIEKIIKALIVARAGLWGKIRTKISR